MDELIHGNEVDEDSTRPDETMGGGRGSLMARAEVKGRRVQLRTLPMR